MYSSHLIVFICDRFFLLILVICSSWNSHMTFALILAMHHVQYKCTTWRLYFFKYFKNMWCFDCVRTKGAVYAETSWRNLRDNYLFSCFLELVESWNESERLLKGKLDCSSHSGKRKRKIEMRYAGNEWLHGW